MIVSRCITCLLEYPQNAPAFCRCGGSTFTTMHRDDVVDDAPTTAPEGHKLEPAAASTSSPTPPPVSGSSPSSASAPKPGADFELGDEPEAVSELGGIECGQEGCHRPATHKFFWPSPDEPSTRFACEEHAKKAEQLGPALGFSADVQPL